MVVYGFMMVYVLHDDLQWYPKLNEVGFTVDISIVG
jgi:hypothetical protein